MKELTILTLSTLRKRSNIQAQSYLSHLTSVLVFLKDVRKLETDPISLLHKVQYHVTLLMTSSYLRSTSLLYENLKFNTFKRIANLVNGSIKLTIHGNEWKRCHAQVRFWVSPPLEFLEATCTTVIYPSQDGGYLGNQKIIPTSSFAVASMVGMNILLMTLWANNCIPVPLP